MSYTPPDSKLVVLTFTGVYTPPDTRLVSIDMVPPATGNTQVVYPNAIGDYGAGAPGVQNKAVALYPAGIDDVAFGTLATANLSRAITANGFTNTALGTPEKVWNFHSFVRGAGVGETDNDEQKPTVRNQHEYLRLSGAGHSRYGQPEMSHEDRGIHALAPTHTVANLAAEKFTPACVAGGYGFFSGFTTHFEDLTNGQRNIEYFWARVDYPSLTNPVKVLYTGNGRIDRDGRAVVATDGSYLYTFHVDVSNGGTSIPTLAKRDFDYNILAQATYSPSKALGSVFVIGGRLYLHTDMSALLIEEIDKNTLAPISSCPVESSENSTSDGTYIYLNYSARQVAIFDPITNSIIGTTPMTVTPEQNGIITTHRNITRAIGAQGKIWACMYERDIDPNLTTLGVRSLLLIYDRSTLTLEKTISLDALGYSPAVATTLAETGGYVIAAPNGPVGSSGYYVFDATTAAPLGGFPGVNFPSEAITNPRYEGIVPATGAVPIPTRVGRGLTCQFTIGPWEYGGHNAIEWLFPALAVFPDNKLLMSVISASDTIYDLDFNYARFHRAIPAATIAMRVNVENTWVETLAPGGIAPPAMDSRPSIRMQWQVVVPASTKHSVVNEVDFQLKNRQVFPRDVFDTSFGIPVVRSNLLAPAGFDSLVVSLPDITDRHQDVFPATVNESAHMGDPPRVWNRTILVTPESVDHSAFQAFQPTVYNRTKETRSFGFTAERWGTVQVDNKAAALYLTGLNATEYGDSVTTNWFQYRGTTGTDTSLFGVVDILNTHLAVRFSGADTAAVGNPGISLKHQNVTIDGIPQPTQDSEPGVALYVREFGPFGGSIASFIPAADVSYSVRRLLPQTFSPALFGQLDVALAVRGIALEGIFFQTPAAAFGPPRLSPSIQTVLAVGAEHTEIPSLGIARNETVADQLTLGSQTVFGTTQIELARRVVRTVTSATTDLHGEPKVWNWRTYMSTWSPVMPDILGTAAIELRNKLLYPLGYDMARVGAYTTAVNNARLLGPTGDDLSQFGTLLAADRVRNIRATGDDLSRFGSWLGIFTTLKIVGAVGFYRTRYGAPYVWRNERLVGVDSCGDSGAIGDTMAADRIRTITQYRYADPMMGFPTVGLYTQYVTPEGFTGRFGETTLAHFRNGAHIFGNSYTRYGMPAVHNFNPQAWVDGIGAPVSIDIPWVSFRTRPIDLTGQSVGEYTPPPPVVEFRDRTVLPTGYAADAIPRTHDIRFDMPQGAAAQQVLAEGVGAPQSSRPSISSNIVSPDSTAQTRFGSPEITANSIWPTSGLSVFSFVAPPMVSLRNRTIFIKTTQLPAIFDPSRVVMSPYVVGPFGDIRADWLIDAHLAERGREFDRPFFGAPTVTNFNRAITTLGAKHGVWGIPVVATNQIAPDGWDSNEGKFGMTDFAGPIYIAPYWGRTTDDYIPEVPAYNFDTALYGQPNLAYPVIPPVWSPYITPQGLHSFDPGRPFVESTIRNVYPAGIEYDGDDEGWIPNVWLHPPFHLYPEGAVPPEPAISQIAFRIRSLAAQGDDMAIVCEEDAQMISARFRVRHGASRYMLVGIAPEAPTILQITHRNRSVAAGAMPEGVTSPARVQAQNIVVPAGADTAQLGIIRRAVYGELYPYAPDTALYGYPKTNRRAYTGGVAAPAVADIRIARPLRPQGADCAGAGGAAVTNPYGCRDRAIIVGGDTDFSTFGGAHATN